MKNLLTIAIFAISVNGIAQSVCSSDTIIPIHNLPTVRTEARLVAYNSDIYVFGGTDNTTVVNSVYKYSTSNNSWSALTNMPTARGEVGVAEVNGIVYCIGGWTGVLSDKNEAYNISTNSWQTLANLPIALTGGDAVSLNNKVYVIGGTLGMTTTYFYKYDPSQNTYVALATPAQNRLHGRLLINNNKIYWIGGSYYNGAYHISNNLDEYDTLTNAWSPKAQIPLGLALHSATIFENKIHVFCGSTTTPTLTPLNSHFAYDFLSDSWISMANLPFSRIGIETITNNSIVYIIGGASSSTAVTDSCFKYFCTDFVGINPKNISAGFKIFPNPAKDYVTLDFTGYSTMVGYSVNIVNILGRIIYTSKISQEQFVADLSNSGGKGMFFIKLMDEQNNTIEIKKIVLQ